MGALVPSYAILDPSSSYDQLSMRRTLLLSDNLKDLRNLRSQLYSAADYFELSYIDDALKQIVVDSLKDYAVRVLVNTVDHLGSVSHKVNTFLDEKINEVSRSDIRVSCIEQRLRTCQEVIEHEGIKQQSLVLSTPKYHKRYTMPVGESMPASLYHATAQHLEPEMLIPEEERQLLMFKAALSSNVTTLHSANGDGPLSTRKLHAPPSRGSRFSSPLRKVCSPSPSPQPRVLHSSAIRTPDSRAGLPIPASNPSFLVRYGSLSRGSNNLNSFNVKQYPARRRKATSDRLHAERDYQEDGEQNPSRSKLLLKALLSRRKPRRDNMLYISI